MSDWREQKRAARNIVHDAMALDAQYYREAGVEPVPVRARLHLKFNAIGDDRSAGWAEMQAVKPRVLFMLTDLQAIPLSIERGGIVLFQIGEAYMIDNTLPPDDKILTVEVSRVSATQYVKYALPVEEVAP